MKVARGSIISALVFSSLALACSSSDDDSGGGAPGGPGPGGGGCTGDGCFAVSLSMTIDLSCAAMKDGTARCWGPAYADGRGWGETPASQTAAPTPVVQLTGASNVFVNGDASCALQQSGAVSCWGSGSTGGDGTGSQPTTGTEVPKPISVTSAQSITGGTSTTCALTQDGSAWCWQDVLYFVPDSTPSPALSPIKIDAVQGAKELAVGADHLCVLGADAKVSCIGANGSGQLGYDTDGQSSTELKPITGDDLGPVAHISAGDGFTCAVLVDGTAECWGLNDSGQLGDGTAGSPRFDHKPVTGLTNVASIATGHAGAGHACALLTDGTAKCWGANQTSQLGDGTTTQQPTPVAVAGVTDATQIAVGPEATCAIRTDGRVVCWGQNANAEFGAETSPEIVTTPYVVPF